MIALVVFTDGRWDLLERTLATAGEYLNGPITSTVLVVDGEHDYQRISRGLQQLYVAFPTARPNFRYHCDRLGFGGSIAAAWRYLTDPKAGPEWFVFHLEDDFTFHRDVDLEAMTAVLGARPKLVQLALRRQPWNAVERDAGGIIESHPDAYEEQTGAVSRWNPDGIGTYDTGVAWLEHRLFFTTNPSLYRRDLCARGWPTVDHSEGVFTHQLLANPDVRFGFWGARDSGEWVEHIGAARAGTGY